MNTDSDLIADQMRRQALTTMSGRMDVVEAERDPDIRSLAREIAGQVNHVEHFIDRISATTHHGLPLYESVPCSPSEMAEPTLMSTLAESRTRLITATQRLALICAALGIDA